MLDFDSQLELVCRAANDPKSNQHEQKPGYMDVYINNVMFRVVPLVANGND